MQGARLAGAGRIIAIDLVQAELNLATRFGATDQLLASDDNAHDPPLHTQLRGLVSRSFSPRAVANLEDAVRRSVQAHTDRIGTLPPFDVCADFADRVPADVMYDLMGVPQEDRARVFGYNEDFNDVGDATAVAGAPSARRLSGQQNMVQYVIELASASEPIRRTT